MKQVAITDRNQWRTLSTQLHIELTEIENNRQRGDRMDRGTIAELERESLSGLMKHRMAVRGDEGRRMAGIFPNEVPALTTQPVSITLMQGDEAFTGQLMCPGQCRSPRRIIPDSIRPLDLPVPFS